jgi:hypothetical protein
LLIAITDAPWQSTYVSSVTLTLSPLFSGGAAGTDGAGGDVRFNDLEEEQGLGYAHETVRQAITNLEEMEASLGINEGSAGWTMVWKESFNHKGSSAYAGRMRKKVASQSTVI